jgi:biotin-(acetyl-CoA carboxylase) ligase
VSLRTEHSNSGQPGALDLPPGFEAVMLREHADAVRHASTIAAERGAGTLVWVRRFDVVEFAVVLEPDEPLAGARRALYAAKNAVADSLSAFAPPEKPVTFTWPDTILVDGGILGGARLVWPDGTSEDDIPDWLVAGFVLRSIIPHMRVTAPGAHVLDERNVKGTSLATEGFEMLDGAALISSFARHLLVHVDHWQSKGFAAIGQDYLARMPRSKGQVRGIDGNGDLLERKLADMKTVARSSLVEALATPGWIDPQTQEPWL